MYLLGEAFKVSVFENLARQMGRCVVEKNGEGNRVPASVSRTFILPVTAVPLMFFKRPYGNCDISAAGGEFIF